jgi:hypothetical protein
MKKIKVFLMCLLIGIAAGIMIYAGPDLQVIVPPSKDYALGNICLYSDNSNRSDMMALYNVFNMDKPPDIYFHVLHNNRWSSGIKTNFFPGNQKIFYSVDQLANNLPIAIIGGDDSVYADVFALDYLAENNNSENPLDAYGLSTSDVWDMLWNNQRLFFSIQKNGIWTDPVPITDTHRASNVIMKAGPNNTALMVFYKDLDTDYSTTHDIQLFYSFFNNHRWTEPQQLTSNDEIKYSVQLVATGSRYLITWAQDSDSDTKTLDDRSMYYSVVQRNGKNTTVQAINENEQTIITPVLGRYGENALLAYVGADETPGDTSPVMYSLSYSFNEGKWESPEKSQLETRYFAYGKIIEIDGILYLFYLESGHLKIAYYYEGEWISLSDLFRARKAGINVKEINYFLDTANTLHILITGSIKEAVRTGENNTDDDDNIPENNGLYYTSIPFLPDLHIKNLAVSPKRVNTGEKVTIRFDVINNGYVPSGDYLLRLLLQGEEIGILPCSSLMPFEKREFVYESEIKHINSVLDVTVSSPVSEIDKLNNEISTVIKVLPDYEPLSVKREDVYNFTVRIAEHKKMAAPRVPVTVYLQQNDVVKTIGSYLYNPLTFEPVRVSLEDILNPDQRFTFVVSLNEERKIREDDYSNNKTTFIFNPLPDLSISDAGISDEEVKIKIQNLGAGITGDVTLVMTDDPALLAALQGSTLSQMLYTREIDFSGVHETEVTIGLDEIPEITGKQLYIAINPLMDINESNYNNNIFKVYLSGITATAGKKIYLMVKYAIRVEDLISISIMNFSKYPALMPVLEGYNRKRERICKKIIPVIKAGGSEHVFIDDPEKEIRYLKLVYESAGKIKESFFCHIIKKKEWLLVKAAFRIRGMIKLRIININKYPVSSLMLKGYNRWGKEIYENQIPVIEPGATEKVDIPDNKRKIYYFKLIYQYKDTIKERKIYPSYKWKYNNFKFPYGKKKVEGDSQ